MPYVETEEGKLFYTGKKGPQEAPAFVLVHGAGGSRLHWPPELRRLSQATVYTLDLPGHGRSPGPGRHTIAAYAACVAAFLGALRVGSATIAGHSMGGAVAQKLALIDSHRISSLVLVGTGARLRVAPAILESIEADFERAVDLITRYAWSQDADPALRALGRKALQDIGPDVVLGDLTACDNFDVMDRLGEIEAPTLVIGGSDDRLTPIKYSRFLADHVPNARLVTIDGAGHMVMLERPAQVVKAIERFGIVHR